MTPSQAQAALKRRLVFGDAEQIQALSILEQIQKATEAIQECEHDYGENRRKLCSCLTDFSPAIVRAALDNLKHQAIGSFGQNTPDEVRRCI